jgi:hypothetical protein
MTDTSKAYYTPNIVYFRMGYKYQLSTGMKVDSTTGNMSEEWIDKEASLTTDFTEIFEQIEADQIRVAYLTKEDIVNTGWELEGAVVILNQPSFKPNNDIIKFVKGNHFMLYDFNRRSLMIAFSKDEVHAVKVQHIYCPSVNEFEYILHAIDFTP